MNNGEDSKIFIHINDALDRLKNVKKSGSGYTAQCPSHDDDTNSLSVKRGADGRFVCFCHTKVCTYEDVVKDLGLWQEPEKKKAPVQKKVVKTYDYTDEQGNLVTQVVRYEPKDFRQRRPDGKGGWIYNTELTPRFPYRVVELMAADKEQVVFIVGGEKDADRLISLGLVATTNISGEGKWEASYNKYFKGRDVVVIGDNDDAGRKHVDTVTRQVYRSASSVRSIIFEELPKGGDISDWLDNPENTVSLLADILEGLEPHEFTDEELVVDLSQSHNVEAEMAILGAVLKNDVLIGKVIDSDLLKYYYNPKTKIILKAMLYCFENRIDINYITVGEALGHNLAKIGGHEFLKTLPNTLPENFNIDNLIDIVKSKAQFRELLAEAKKLTTSAGTEADKPKQLVDEFIDKVHDIQAGTKSEGFTRIENHTEDVLLRAIENNGKGITGLPTGLADLDWITSGLQRTDLIIVAGRPSMGKTALALTIAQHAGLKESSNIGIFSLEMSKEQLVGRLVCSEGFVDSFDYRNGTMDESSWARFRETIPTINNASVYIDDTPALGFNDIRSKAIRLKADLEREGDTLDFLVIDYLQLIRGSSNNRFQDISQIVRDLKSLAKELEVPLMVLSQLSRAPELRNPPRPIMSDLKETGEIEAAADVILLLYREEYYNATEENKGIAEVIVAKQRNGKTGSIYLAYIDKFTRFFSLFRR